MVLTLGGSAAAELGIRGGVSPLQAKGRFSIVVENDLFSFGVGDGTDRFYSNGIYLHSEWSSPLVDKLTRALIPPPFVAATDKAYAGLGLSHELHTPQTLTPCGAKFEDKLATSENPRDVPIEDCLEAERDWTDNYAERDRPFAAVWSLFLTMQRYFHSSAYQNALTQGRLWFRGDLGTYGAGAALGYEVQKHWHGFLNEALEADGEDLSSEPIGWVLPGQTQSHLLLQASAGVDLSLYRLTLEDSRFGTELDARSRLLVGVPRNELGVGLALRGGLLPDHAKRAIAAPGELQTFQAYLELSSDPSLVVTDLTYGEFDRYRHFRDEYSVGLVVKPWGVRFSAHLSWQRILFKEPLKLYPSTSSISSNFHRYGRVGVEFTY